LATPSAPPDISLTGLRKQFGDVTAVDNVDLEIAKGEFFTMLGPSGSGKTTTLRLIAGFERPDAGRVSISGQDVTDLPPYERDVNTVFQDYALFPHMSVAENVEYGLRVKGVGRKERAQRAQQTLELVDLGAFGGRRPIQLSGGQRQRIALARALYGSPKLIVLDEPDANLDLAGQAALIGALGDLKARGVTVIVVTHNPSLTTALDKLLVLKNGALELFGPSAAVMARMNLAPQANRVVSFPPARANEALA
jgi:putative spermidine/putrescine transport system ATP-binding protein